jgi:hypothetical protein
MQLRLVLQIMAVLVCAGCGSTAKDPEAKGKSIRVAVQTNDFAGPGRKGAIRPVESLHGRVVGVNDQLRFVIVDFVNQKLPRLEQKLVVYRLDQKVAEVKVSGPYRGTTVAADITAGEAQMGDIVRDEK